MKKIMGIVLGVVALVGVSAMSMGGCGDDNGGTGGAGGTAGAGGSGGSGGSGGMMMPDASCFMNPMTHVEIINACTTAQSVDKHPTLPLQYPDGGLPPLP